MALSHWSYQRVVIVIAVLMCISIILALLSGSVSVPIQEVIKALGENSDGRNHMILFDIRLPRLLLALFCGALLAMTGAAMQGLFRNPLADPSLIGVSSGASLGASLVILFGATVSGFFQFHWLNVSLVSIGAFIGAVLTTSLVYRLGKTPYGTSVATMLLAGIAINGIVGALINFLTYIADEQALRHMTFWRMGSFQGSQWDQVGYLFVCTLVVGGIFIKYAKSLNALLLGESEARHLGVDVARLTRVMILITAFAIALLVSNFGFIGFIGIIVPHIVRMILGPEHKQLFMVSALLGATVVLIADVIARTLVQPSELPVGVLTALLGAPFFISILVAQRTRVSEFR